MDTKLIVTGLLEQLVVSVVEQEDGIANKPHSLSCFEFNEDASNSPLKLNLKRRHKFNQPKVETTGVKSTDKKVKLCDTERIGYVFSPELVKEVSRLPKVKGRAQQVHSLISSYQLLDHLKILPAREASEDDLRSFHSREYIDYIKSCENNKSVNKASQRPSVMNDNAIEDNIQENANVKKLGTQKELEWNESVLDTSQRGEEDFGLGYDCPLLPDMFNLIKLIAGSTLTAVEAIIDGKVDIAINWAGGWHHALKESASGFCYVNDIVIGILKLLSHGYSKVLYVDFDLHHGDGVELAFGHSSKVFTLSFHKYDIGFFPGTGAGDDIGPNGSKGKGYTMNIPLKDGIKDDSYKYIVNEVLSKVIDKIKPEAIVAQFGADGLVSDPMNSFNLTPKSLLSCLGQLKATKIPLIVLGGGGYNIPNTARCWTLLTASAIGCEVENDIPDSDSCFLTYGPGYELMIDPGFRKDENTLLEIEDLLQTVRKNLNLLNASS